MQQSSLSIYKNQLKQHGLRFTELKRDLYFCLYNSDSPLTTKELIGELDSFDPASVYRSTNQLISSGIVIQVPIGLKYSYELNDKLKPHHHHITCESCGSTQAIHDIHIEALLKKVTIENGLSPTRHHFELYGICKNCPAKA